MRTLTVYHPTMHDPGHNAVVEVVHFQCDALKEIDGARGFNGAPAVLRHSDPHPPTHHGLVRVLLKLDQTDPGDVLQVHVPIGAVRGVPVQVGRCGRGRHPERLVAVDFVGHHVVGLQQGLRNGRRPGKLNCGDVLRVCEAHEIDAKLTPCCANRTHGSAWL